MDNSEQVARAVEALVRLQFAPDAPDADTLMDLDDDSQQEHKQSQVYEAKVAAAQEYCLRILGSRIAPSLVSDEVHISDLIKKKLMRDDTSSAKAIRFSHLYTKLSACPVLKKKWSVLYFLLAVSDQASTSTDRSQSLPYLGLHSLDTTRVRERERERTSTAQSDTTMAAHSRHGSMQAASSQPSGSGSQPRMSGVHVGSSLGGDEGRPVVEHEEVEESALLRDLIFVFQGIDGKMVKFGAESGTCSIDPAFNISNSTRGLVNRLTELGWLYKRINTYVQTTLKESTAGLVGQSFCSALQHELVDYFRLIAVLEAHIAKDKDATNGSKGLSLKRLLVWTQDSLQRLRLMSVLVECCQDLQGGALVSMVHDYTQHGDPLIQQFINHMLERVSAPFYVMLQRWIYEGELDDPRTEFFIACDPEVEEEDMWQKKYFIREEMLPAFIGMSLAKKILSIGKSLNFLRHKCNDADWFLQTGMGKTLRYGDIAELEGSIDAAYIGTSQRLLHLLVTKFKLIDHLTAIKRYILLGQGDFIQHLMESLGTNLSQPANTLFRHNLTGTLETAIRSSNAQYDDPDILRRLDVRLLEISPGDSGWDVFSLDYHVDSPINTILTPVAMHQYLKMFNFLWRLKRVEIVCSEMIHFVYQLQYYILFEVLECSWDELLKTIENNTTDLDSLIEAHSKYLRDVSSKGLLAASHDVNMMPRLLELLATILDYKVAQDNLYNYALAEIERRERLAQTADRRTRHGQWGLTDQDDTLDRIPDEQFEELVPGLLRTLNEYSMQFKRELSELLITLSADGDSDLRFLSFRLDFNEFYLGSLKSVGRKTR
ncbi:Gamma-tubulin complex component 3 [Podila clonocystis]|nr:Gamma-tubulin complex component 3 [Podila clonocystis]